MALHNELGVAGEQLARDYLEKKGFLILDTNWRCGKKEIDIIAREGAELVIVEVKTRTGDYFGYPWESVTDHKIRLLVHATEAYIQIHDINLETRFDVVSVILTDNTFEIEHIRNAFTAPLS
ncbi:MAG: YraN family protein [Bacteroidota bacterium]|nr:YraN family protein [Bacteroidota bacterium]